MTWYLLFSFIYAQNDCQNTYSQIICAKIGAIYKGPDVFGKVLGPTADESILVGLQALLDMAGTLEFTGFTPSPSAHESPVNSSSKESREASEPISQRSASCQSYVPVQREKSFSSPEVIL